MVLMISVLPIAVFILGTPTQVYKFLASSGSDKEAWVKKLKACVEKEKEAFVEVQAHCLTY